MSKTGKAECRSDISSSRRRRLYPFNRFPLFSDLGRNSPESLNTYSRFKGERL